jgi:hypothetical protein
MDLLKLHGEMVAFKALHPETVNLVFPDPAMQAIQVIRFDFTNQLHALLSDSASFGNLENLEVNLVDPLAKYAPPSDQPSTVNSGSVYNLAYKNRYKKANDFIFEIIFAWD